MWFSFGRLFECLVMTGRGLGCLSVTLMQFFFPHERSSRTLGMGNKDRAFSDLFTELGLIDLGFFGPQFARSRGLDSDTFVGARIDRMICNTDWCLMFSNVTVKHLPRA